MVGCFCLGQNFSSLAGGKNNRARERSPSQNYHQEYNSRRSGTNQSIPMRKSLIDNGERERP